MKRAIAILLCLFLVGTLALSASAASAHMSISSSAGTVHRGDTFTLSINLSNTQPLSEGGIVLIYDSSVFEIAGGKCLIDNPTFEDVGADNSCTFALQPDAIVSGTIFVVTLRVKDNAAFGSYTISGDARVKSAGFPIDCNCTGTTVTVECSHSFGAATKVDGNNHQSTCSICKQTVKAAHTYNQGTVTKAPTCKDTGVKTFKCTACGVEKTETVPVSTEHKFGEWTSQTSGGHSHKCSVCGKEEHNDHSWYTYEILEAATCQSEGRQIVICEYCDESAEMETPLADHSYGAPTNVTATEHTHKCSVCGSESTEEHVFGEELAHDKQMHYYACETCGYKKDQAEHEPGPKATEETDQVCLVCNRVLKPKGAHVHDFMEEWASDENNHWHDCVDCPARDTEMPHVFDSDCDDTCDVCGLTRQVTHLPIPILESDETGHWYPCLICGEKQSFSAHTPGPAATSAAAQLCTECEFEIAPIVPHDHVYDIHGTLHTHKCACGQEYEADAETCGICAKAHKQFPWWIVCILEALIFGGVIVYLIMKKRNDPPFDDEPIEDEEEPEELPDDLDERISKILSADKPTEE